jgi:hypothetical protein
MSNLGFESEWISFTIRNLTSWAKLCMFSDSITKRRKITKTSAMKDVLKKDVRETCKCGQLTVSEVIEMETVLDHFYQYGFVPCKKYYKKKVLSISIMQ